jgi:ribose-phosphate pyrophosphokinase
MPAPVAAAYFHEEFSSIPPPPNAADKPPGNRKRRKKKMSVRKPYYPPVTVVASHENMVGRASQFRSVLQRLSGSDDVEIAVLSRTKMRPGERQYSPDLVGNVRGRKCILVDDIVNTGVTLVSNIHQLKQEGAESIYAWATHGVFGTPDCVHVNDAPDRIQQLDDLEYLLISNSVANPLVLPPKIRLLNVAPLLAEAIARAVHDQSISSILSLEPVEALERYDGE